MKHYIIIANGNFLVREIIEEAAKDKIIVALDGAANKLARIGVVPHIILGDFDSVTEASARYWGIKLTFNELDDASSPYQGNHGVTIVPAKNQQLTDLVKAIHYCDQHGAESIAIICAAGGRMDHHEAAMRALRTEYKSHRPILLHTEQQSIRFATNEKMIMRGETGDKCGILAYPQGSFTSVGLEYEVSNYELKFGFADSTCNSLKQPEASINITGEALLIMPPMLISQRKYMKKSEVERLELQLRDAREKTFDDLALFKAEKTGSRLKAL
jgi:thiamine pyrophosphokinase